MPNYKLYKYVYREKIRSVVKYNTMSQTGLTVLIQSIFRAVIRSIIYE